MWLQLCPGEWGHGRVWLHTWASCPVSLFFIISCRWQKQKQPPALTHQPDCHIYRVQTWRMAHTHIHTKCSCTHTYRGYLCIYNTVLNFLTLQHTHTFLCLTSAVVVWKFSPSFSASVSLQPLLSARAIHIWNCACSHLSLSLSLSISIICPSENHSSTFCTGCPLCCC